MKLVDEAELKLLSNLKIEKTISGGSVANSTVGLSQLGNDGKLEKLTMMIWAESIRKDLQKKKSNFIMI